MERKVYFYSGPGLKLCGILEAASGHRSPGIVLCQAGTGTKDVLLPEVSAALVRRGYAVLRFDCRGYGESQGPPCRLIPLDQVEDVRNAITFMQQQDAVDAELIGLWGPSSGGANASYAAGIDVRVKCMVSLSGMGDMGRWLQAARRYWEWRELLDRLEQDRKERVLTGSSRRVPTSEIVLPVASSGMETLPSVKQPAAHSNELALESVEAMIAFQPESVVDRISPRAAMWLCATGDTVVPVEESQAMFRKAHPPKKIVPLAGFRHYELYHGAGFNAVMSHSTAWFDRYLKRDEAAGN